MTTRAAVPGTTSPNDIWTSANVASLPGGLVARATKSTDQTGISADADITGLSETLVLASGRTYKVSVIAHVITTSGGGLFRVNIEDDGSRIQIDAGNASTTEICTATPWALIDGDGASHTVNAHLDLITAGTYTVLSTVDSLPSVLIIEDVGPTAGFA